MPAPEVALTCLAGGAWFVFYKCVELAVPDRSPEWCSRVVAASHAVVATALAAYAIKVSTQPFSEVGAENEYAQDVAIVISLGYFIYDIDWMVLYTPEDRVMFAHHLISAACLAFVTCTGRSGLEACGTLVAMELTNPILQARWFIRDAGYKDTLGFKAVDLTFIGLFIVCRLGAGTFFLYHILRHPRPKLGLKILGASFYGVSVVFLGAMIKYVYRKYLSPAE